ncbi:LexA family protein [Clostridium beijerinckii]|uniref:LexA family protein n=1 Tax=Clostridium beijerinckii TaxID=1520 RepID=UPI00136167DB|nr:winged helix-turn-helix transcriptional regulator [Clostridium beijerinckii]MZK53867.1 winged helix-turn-helix transcriptional regulator [Clostridium beijerinckii]MZK61989.1 winged helix-turn-helix transcriptional regulator [Clostridium beijerinckii]MZK72182.1 winged helix-turn-helix transcriptional regulator [Clostridium beijerinckii]MZK77598.1 winged helix-turn-helix transcriptional regulator [Clostridium beijerinckii]MZK87147.1 winged helix-turn-helix transcriptional regulator [Clostridi
MLTEKQREIFNIIKNYIDKERISPTIREICEIAGLKSSSTVHSYLSRLEEKGYIYKLDNCPRSIRVKENN